MNEKAQGRTFWIVVTAVVALVVLVILLMIFTGKTGMLEKGLMSCEGKGGFCTPCSKATPGNCDTACKTKCKDSADYEDCSYSSAFSCETGYGCCLGVKKTVD